MAASKLNNTSDNNENIENITDTGTKTNSLKSICMKYKKFIATGAMLVLLAVVIASSRTSSDNGGSRPGVTGKAGDGAEAEEFKIDEYPQINELFEKYYGYYASGDTDSIEKIAYPVTDAEKSYIRLFSGLVDSYENIQCYTKKGLADDEFVVSVAVDMKFKDIKTAAPNLESFYVRKDDSGSYYIDNAYSRFNQSNQENTTDEGINTRMTDIRQAEDGAALEKQVQEDYAKAMDSDSDLEKMLKDTLQDEISDWVASFGSKPSDKPVKDPDGDKNATVTERIAYTSTKVNLRKKCSTSSDAIKVLKKGAEVTVYGESKDGWYEVKAGSDTGFVSDEYIVSKKPGSGNSGQQSSDNQETSRTAYAKTQVNLRKKRSTSSDVIRTLKAGTEVTVYGDSQDGWYKVKAGSDSGFVSDEYIVSDKSQVEKQNNNSQEKTRTAYAKTKVNLRKSRSTSSKVLKTLKAGTEVTIYGKSTNGWHKVKVNGKTGYIRSEYIVSDKSKVEKSADRGQQSSNNHSAPAYYNEGDRIRLSDSVNIRASMSESADRVGLAYQGDVVTVIMSYAEGWTKVNWNGQTGYIKTEYLR